MTIGRKTIYKFLMLPFYRRINILMDLGFRQMTYMESDLAYLRDGIAWLVERNKIEKFVEVVTLTIT